MFDLLASGVWSLPASYFFPWGFVVLFVALIGFMVDDLRRAGKASAAKKSGSKFVSRYREDDGMAMLFYAGDDPLPQTAHRAMTQERRGKS